MITKDIFDVRSPSKRKISESDMQRMFLATTIALGLAFAASGVASAAPTQKCIEAKQSLANLQSYANTVPDPRKG